MKLRSGLQILCATLRFVPHRRRSTARDRSGTSATGPQHLRITQYDYANPQFIPRCAPLAPRVSAPHSRFRNCRISLATRDHAESSAPVRDHRASRDSIAQPVPSSRIASLWSHCPIPPAWTRLSLYFLFSHIFLIFATCITVPWLHFAFSTLGTLHFIFSSSSHPFFVYKTAGMYIDR